MQFLVSVRALRHFWPSAILIFLNISCGGGPSNSNGSTSPGNVGTSSQFGHVVLVVEENHNYSDVVGNASMPYLNSLIAKYGLATQYYPTPILRLATTSCL